MALVLEASSIHQQILCKLSLAIWNILELIKFRDTFHHFNFVGFSVILCPISLLQWLVFMYKGIEEILNKYHLHDGNINM